MAMHRHFPLHIHIAALFVVLILIFGGLTSGIAYLLSTDMLESAASDVMQRMSRETLDEVQKRIAPAEMAVKLIGQSALTNAHSLDERLAGLGTIREALDTSPALNAVYVGYANGDFFYIRRVPDGAERAALGAPRGTRYIVQSIERGGPAADGHYLYVDAGLKVLKNVARPGYAESFDPRSREWYRLAQAAGTLVRTAPYAFYTNGKIGLTLAVAAPGAQAVVGGDITLDALGQALARQRITKGMVLALVNQHGELIADDALPAAALTALDAAQEPRLRQARELGIPVLAKLAEDIPAAGGDALARASVTLDGEPWYTSVARLPLGGGEPLYLVAAVREDELLQAADRLRFAGVGMTVLIVLLAIPLTWVAARRIAKPLRALAREADAIRHFEFAHPFSVRSHISEVRELGITMDGMKRTIRQFLGVIHGVTAERSFERLVPMLLAETVAAAEADAGVLYLIDGDLLQPAAALNRNIDVTASLAKTPLHDALVLVQQVVRDGAARAAHLNRAEIADAQLAALSNDGERHAVAVPLLNLQGQLVGLFLLLRATTIEDARLSFVKALAGLAAGALETRELIKSQRDLFEAFIKLIAGAIDAKSPYTGGHCARVPELAKMLAKAACDAQSGPYEAFRLREDEWEALHVAAWLHDCGKVTTPEFVIDKATKLETIHDRIHEVRMRFEVLKRDEEIAYLKALAAGEDADVAEARRARNLAQLDDDFAFVAECNVGSEAMEPACVERLARIGERTWLRTLDDRIGISHEEKRRKERTPAAPLPALEPLLADKPEHRIERDERTRITADNPWGFKMTSPELLYDHGERYNLSVARGTLSAEERFKINEHIMQTLIMLSQLPFPKHLRQVPEIAGGHHEKMDGTGYPKRLTGDQMSPLARMMAIADIFEALTAADRPYKKAKTLSESVRIMSFMKRDSHIDPELFDLFLTSGVYREYAERFMAPEQIDEVDIERYLEPAVAD
jgi:HD-GYP domain-containing protein (c-di-GMP phosphodiesterase class II)